MGVGPEWPPVWVEERLEERVALAGTGVECCIGGGSKEASLPPPESLPLGTPQSPAGTLLSIDAGCLRAGPLRLDLSPHSPKPRVSDLFTQPICTQTYRCDNAELNSRRSRLWTQQTPSSSAPASVKAGRLRAAPWQRAGPGALSPEEGAPIVQHLRGCSALTPAARCYLSQLLPMQPLS